MGYLSAKWTAHTEQEVQATFLKQNMNIMKDSQTLEKLFALYLASHYDGVMLKGNFELGLRRLANSELARLKDVLLEKDEKINLSCDVVPILGVSQPQHQSSYHL